MCPLGQKYNLISVFVSQVKISSIEIQQTLKNQTSNGQIHKFHSRLALSVKPVAPTVQTVGFTVQTLVLSVKMVASTVQTVTPTVQTIAFIVQMSALLV